MLVLLLLFLALASPCILTTMEQVHGAHTPPGATAKSLFIKLAVFVDNSLRRHLVDNIRLDGRQIKHLMEAYVGQMEAALVGLKSPQVAGGVKLKLVEVNEFNATSGNLDKLLSDFCLYQMMAGDDQGERTFKIKRWDLGLLLTNKDLYSEEEQRSLNEDSSSTLGISPVSGIDWPDLSCLVVELGVGYQLDAFEDSPWQRVYPTRGLASAYVAAHELAHSLGLQHDDVACDPLNLHVMSPNQSPRLDSMRLGWSPCSSALLEQLAPSLLARFGSTGLVRATVSNLPGQVFDGQFQCRMFSRRLDFDPSRGSDEAICNKSLKCTTSDNRLVAIGPALEGTKCGVSGEEICLHHFCSKPPPLSASDADL